jgi:hypothetical protein
MSGHFKHGRAIAPNLDAERWLRSTEWDRVGLESVEENEGVLWANQQWTTLVTLTCWLVHMFVILLCEVPNVGRWQRHGGYF